MSRYIDADKLVGILLEKNYNSTTGKINFGDVIYLVNSQPTADLQEVKHGKWEKRCLGSYLSGGTREEWYNYYVTDHNYVRIDIALIAAHG